MYVRKTKKQVVATHEQYLADHIFLEICIPKSLVAEWEVRQPIPVALSLRYLYMFVYMLVYIIICIPAPHNASYDVCLFVCAHISKCTSAPRKTHHQHKLQQVMTP